MEPENEFNPNNIQQGKSIGKGQFGEVFSGYLKSSGKKIAIKKVNKKTMEKYGQYLINAFFSELECMKKCNCENSVLYYYNMITTNNYNLIMELCDGDLEKELQKRPNGFSVDEVRYIISQLNNAFKKMDENNIIHRDLKLQNILIKYTDESKTKFIPKLSDYGFSKKLDERKKVTKTKLGTPSTMAPEVLKNLKYDKKADLWSVGVLLYQLHFNDLPYNAKNPNDILKMIESQIPFTQPKDYFLKDLINKLLVEDPINRLSWKEYFEHPFFKTEEERNEILKKIKEEEGKNNLTDNQNIKYIVNDNIYIHVRDFDTGLNNNSYKCVIAKDTKNNNKLVLIKIYSKEFVTSHFSLFNLECHLFRTFLKNNNVLQLINIQKDDTNYYLKFNFIDCTILPNYMIAHEFNENKIQIFNKELIENIFNFSEINFRPFLFISLYSFAISKDGKPILFDLGIHQFFLSPEELGNYFLPNLEEKELSLNPVKTNVMNYGITLLKLFYKKDYKLEIINNQIILPSNKIIDDDFKSFMSKCLKKDIKKRGSWSQLLKEKYLKNSNNENEIEKININEEIETLIGDKKLKGILRSLDTKYELINNYYNSIEINEKTPFIKEMEKFLILTLYEQLFLLKILDKNENKKYKDSTKEISFIDIINNSADVLRINFGSTVFKNMKIFNNNDNKYIIEFIPKLENHISKLKGITKKYNKITKSTFFEGNYQNFLKEFSELLETGIENLVNYCLGLVKEANNDWLNNNLKNSRIKAPIAEYLFEIVLFLVMNIKDIKEEKIYFNIDELNGKFIQIFEKENEENVEVSCIRLVQKKDKYILVSFLGILFKNLINSCSINKLKIKMWNKDKIAQLLMLYQKLMTILLNIK